MLNAFLPYKQTNINKLIFFQHIEISLIKSGLRVKTHTHTYIVNFGGAEVEIW